MNGLKDLIAKMRSKPGMFFSNFSIYCVKAYIDGYVFNKDEGVLLMHNFQNFVVGRFKLSPVLSWDKIIRVYCNSDRDAMEKFFVLFDEFLEQEETL